MSKKGIINQSYELRKLIIQQAERYNIPLTHICKKANVPVDRFISGYCNKQNLSTTYPDVSDSDLIEIAGMLGFDIRMQIIVRKINDAEMLVLKEQLKDAFGPKKKGIINPAE